MYIKLFKLSCRVQIYRRWGLYKIVGCVQGLNNFCTVVEGSFRYIPVMPQPSLISTFSSEFRGHLFNDDT